MTSVAIVDDHRLVAESLQPALLDRGLRSTVVTVCEIPRLLATLLALPVDLVLLDLDLGAFGDSTSMIGALVRARRTVLVVTGIEDRVRIAAALEAGAIGYQPKADGFDALLAAVSAAAAGRIEVDGRARLLAELEAHRRARALAGEPFQRLTDREVKTLGALREGLSVRDIADHWVVSEATVRTHVRGVLSKLGAKSQLAAVAMASRYDRLRYTRL
jgi:two-component system nitrate/nitrite response regulator NarL